MFRKLVLPLILLLLGYGFWISPDFKEIAAGVAIFLFGMLSLEEGFKAFTGGLLEKLLKKTTNRLWKSLSFGVISTTLMQSSSLVSVITISFLSAGLISLTAGVGIIFGANLGTTTGAWLVAGLGLKVKISAYAMPMLVFGILLMFQKSKELKGVGYVLAGLGFLFLGIHYMKEGFEAFKDTIDLTAYAVEGYAGVFLFTLIGLFATVVMQSSHATLVLIITALAAQQITYENALALAIGANIGTTITAIIGSLSANIEGRRLAVAHLIFNATTGFVAILFIYQLTTAVDSVSQYVGIAADNYTLKLAVFHTIFNSIGVLLMLPVIPAMVRFLKRTIKSAPQENLAVTPRYLNKEAAGIPEATLAAVRQETLHLYDNAARIIAGGLSLDIRAIEGSQPLEEVIFNARSVVPLDIDQAYEQTVKSLYADIVGFSSAYQGEMSAEEVDELFRLRAAGRDIVEAIKDTKHLQKNLSRYFVADNPYIQHEYNTLRMRLASVLRELHRVRQQDSNDSVAVLALDRLRLDMEEYDQNLNHSLSSLIRQKLITGPMSVSLMNDSGYASDVTRKLVMMGEMLFSGSDLQTKSVEQSLSLDDEELNTIMDDAGHPHRERR